ncbi:hypothetical protein V6N13_132199 [Hibiscus sabdariffa]
MMEELEKKLGFASGEIKEQIGKMGKSDETTSKGDGRNDVVPVSKAKKAVIKLIEDIGPCRKPNLEEESAK